MDILSRLKTELVSENVSFNDINKVNEIVERLQKEASPKDNPDEVIIRYKGDLCPINQRYEVSNHPQKSSGKHFLLSSSRYRTAHEAISWTAKSQCKKVKFPKGTSLHVHIDFSYKNKVDADAFCKIILDSLTKIVYDDDSQVDSLSVNRRIIHGCEPEAIIKITPISEVVQPLF